MSLQRSIVLALIVGAGSVVPTQADDAPLAHYFKAEVERIAADPLRGIKDSEAWKARRPELQRQLRDMLGLDPLPERTDLRVEVTGSSELHGVRVDRLHFQSMPGLYVTANLYRPVGKPEGRLPAVLYVCGHSRVEKDGVIYGNKAGYQHHAMWYAANGYVCLVLDTLQLGEVPGVHHGMYSQGMWWWQSRGYTPAGVEAWNGLRGIDYLLTLPEVDPARLGVTGRSGGGASSWWIAALDDRLAAAVPVAGITDLRDHIVQGAEGGPYPNGVIEGHCDCMYHVNTERWDFPLLASLVAPKALLLENTDDDPIFPEAGVRRIYEQLETVYGWYDAREKLDLVIGAGGHVDSDEIRHPSYRWMDRWLMGKPDTGEGVEEPERLVPGEAIKVLKPGEVPPHSRNDSIEESFVAEAISPPVPSSTGAWEALRRRWVEALRARVFAGWPAEVEAVSLDVTPVPDDALPKGLAGPGSRVQAWDFTSQEGVRLRLWRLGGDKIGENDKIVAVRVLGAEDWPAGNDASLVLPRLAPAEGRVVLLAPRGIGPTAWPESKDTHVRRRFWLLGQTLDGQRVWDVRRGLTAIRSLPEFADATIRLEGTGPSASLALFAAVFEPEVQHVVLDRPPAAVRDAPPFLNQARVLGMPQALALLYPRDVVIKGSPPASWTWALDLGSALGQGKPWPTFAALPDAP